MIVADLPPVVDAVRLALISSPAAVYRTVGQGPLDADVAAYFAKHESAASGVGKLVDANIAHIRAGIDELRLRIEARDVDIPQDAMETLIVGADAALAADVRLIAEVNRSRAQVLSLPLPSKMRPRLNRLFDRLQTHAERHHDQLVEQGYRLRALAAQLDPEARKIVSRGAAGSAADQLRAVLDG